MKKIEFLCLIHVLSEKGKLTPRPGIMRLIHEIRAAGIILEATSTCEKKAALAILEGTLGKDGFDAFDSVYAGDDVKFKKPSPHIYLLAMSRINAAAECTMAVEDRLHKLRAAHGAGLKCILTPSDTLWALIIHLQNSASRTLKAILRAGHCALKMVETPLIQDQRASAADYRGPAISRLPAVGCGLEYVDI